MCVTGDSSEDASAASKKCTGTREWGRRGLGCGGDWVQGPLTAGEGGVGASGEYSLCELLVRESSAPKTKTDRQLEAFDTQ